MKIEILIFLLFLSSLTVSSLPIPTSTPSPIPKRLQIIDIITDKLIQFGYLASSMRENVDEIIKAIDMYRNFNGLYLDNDEEEEEEENNQDYNNDFSLTLHDKTKPINAIYIKFKKSTEYILNKLLNHNLRRCSMPDFMRSNSNDLNIKVDLMNGNAYYYITSKKSRKTYINNLKARRKLTSTNIKDSFKDEFVKYQIISWWPKTELTWSFINKPVDLSFKDTIYAFNKSFEIWSSYSNLKFKYVKYDVNSRNSIDLLLKFEEANKHDSKCKFKFANTTLAHAFYPTQGSAHFELGRSWTLENRNQTVVDDDLKFNLISVALHEIGHLVGLGHSSNSKSIMYPDYKMETKDFSFHKDDIEVLHYLYGKNSKNNLSEKNNNKNNSVKRILKKHTHTRF